MFRVGHARRTLCLEQAFLPILGHKRQRNLCGIIISLVLRFNSHSTLERCVAFWFRVGESPRGRRWWISRWIIVSMHGRRGSPRRRAVRRGVRCGPFFVTCSTPVSATPSECRERGTSESRRTIASCPRQRSRSALPRRRPRPARWIDSRRLHSPAEASATSDHGYETPRLEKRDRRPPADPSHRARARRTGSRRAALPSRRGRCRGRGSTTHGPRTAGRRRERRSRGSKEAEDR